MIQVFVDRIIKNKNIGTLIALINNIISNNMCPISTFALYTYALLLILVHCIRLHSEKTLRSATVSDSSTSMGTICCGRSSHETRRCKNSFLWTTEDEMIWSESVCIIYSRPPGNLFYYYASGCLEDLGVRVPRWGCRL